MKMDEFIVAFFVLSRRKSEQAEENCFGNISPDAEVIKYTQFVEYSQQSQR